jgi:hypothetical protein
MIKYETIIIKDRLIYVYFINYLSTLDTIKYSTRGVFFAKRILIKTAFYLHFISSVKEKNQGSDPSISQSKF